MADTVSHNEISNCRNSNDNSTYCMISPYAKSKGDKDPFDIVQKIYTLTKDSDLIQQDFCLLSPLV